MKIKYIYFLFLILSIWVINMSFSSGYGSVTNCANCHKNGGGVTTIDSISFYDSSTMSYLINTYTPGRTYLVTLKGKNTSALAKFGFAVSDGNQGTFQYPMANSKITGSSLWEHKTQISGTSGAYTATISWTAPSTGTVNFTGYLAAVNNNGSDNGDKVSSLYSRSLTAQAVLLATDSIYIQSGYNNPLHSGTPVTFKCLATNGGSSPTYQWKVNGTNVGVGSTYTTSSLVNNDIVTCVMTSTLTGVTGSPATSNAIIMKSTALNIKEPLNSNNTAIIIVTSPVKDNQLTLNMNIDGEKTVEILSINGSKVLQIETNQNTLDLSHLKLLPGIYFVQIKKSNDIYYQKFVVE